jgi:hypothetical protein
MHISLSLFNKETTKIDGFVLCFLIITWTKNPSASFLRHESCHVSQFKKQPFSFYPKYFFELFRNKWRGMSWYEAYRAISFEVAAREYAKQLTETE